MHKSHIVTYSNQAFIDTTDSGTLCFSEVAVAAKTSAFLTITSSLDYRGRGCAVKEYLLITKMAAENLCWMISGQSSLKTIVLRTFRFARRRAMTKQNASSTAIKT
ncbi:MAG: hypothetical protein ACJA2Q_002559 [Pseudohongiellaceae bacterium]